MKNQLCEIKFFNKKYLESSELITELKDGNYLINTQN